MVATNICCPVSRGTIHLTGTRLYWGNSLSPWRHRTPGAAHDPAYDDVAPLGDGHLQAQNCTRLSGCIADRYSPAMHRALWYVGHQPVRGREIEKICTILSTTLPRINWSKHFRCVCNNSRVFPLARDLCIIRTLIPNILDNAIIVSGKSA